MGFVLFVKYKMGFVLFVKYKIKAIIKHKCNGPENN